MAPPPEKSEEVTNNDELNYLNQIRKIIAEGSTRTDRTGTGTISIFGMQARYSLRDCKLRFVVELIF